MNHEISSINFKIISLNERGLNNSIKRRKIFNWLHSLTAHCYFLQETFSRTIHKHLAIGMGWNHGSNLGKGVMLLVNPRYQLEVMRSTKDKYGRSIILKIKLDIQNLVLAIVYAPNDIPQQIQFYQNLNQTLRRFSDSNLITKRQKKCETGFEQTHCHKRNRKPML